MNPATPVFWRAHVGTREQAPQQRTDASQCGLAEGSQTALHFRPEGGRSKSTCRQGSLQRGRRRGIFVNPGMVLPREANLRALSRSIKALSASRIKAVFSSTPVNSWALRTRSSSRATVVLIGVRTDYIIK